MMNSAARSGRRPGSPNTRDDILAAARETFADEGYERASLRRIASRAGVDPALITHYFGSKEGLFDAAMSLPFDPEAVAGVVFGPGLDGAGERLCSTFLGLWESADYGKQLRGVVRAAASDARAASRLRRFLEEEMVSVAAGHIGADRPHLRAELAASHLLGTALARYILGVEPLATIPREELASWLGPVIQHYLTGDLESPAPGKEKP